MSVWFTTRGGTIHWSHDSVWTSVFSSLMFFGTAVLFLFNNFVWFYLLNCIKQTPYTDEKTNTIEDKNTMKSRTYFHCDNQLKKNVLQKNKMKCAQNRQTCTKIVQYKYTYRYTPIYHTFTPPPQQTKTQSESWWRTQWHSKRSENLRPRV